MQAGHGSHRRSGNCPLVIYIECSFYSSLTLSTVKPKRGKSSSLVGGATPWSAAARRGFGPVLTNRLSRVVLIGCRSRRGLRVFRMKILGFR
jgi:hypothetical protein